MKVVHICTLLEGGAGIAALMLHKGLLAEGVDSNFLTLSQNLNSIEKVFSVPLKEYSNFEKVASKIRPITYGHKNENKLLGIPREYEIFTFPHCDYDISSHPLIKEADIVNLHWVAGLINYPTFFNKVQKPIVWTLHDMNPFMGGFHYKGDEDSSCSKLKKLNLKLEKLKLRYYRFANIKKVVSPSFWLLKESSKSKLFDKYTHMHCPYGIDTSLFHSYSVKFSRKVLKLPEDKKVFLFVAENLGNQRKGFDLLIDVIKNSKFLKGCQFVVVGNIPQNKVENVLYLGPIKDERLMALAYSAADAFILPSREDNLPNVMLESLACGTPVIATPVGGIREVITDGCNGYLAKDVTSEALKIVIEKFIQNYNLFDRIKIQQETNKKYSLKVQAKEYVQIYRHVLTKRL